MSFAGFSLLTRTRRGGVGWLGGRGVEVMVERTRLREVERWEARGGKMGMSGSDWRVGSSDIAFGGRGGG